MKSILVFRLIGNHGDVYIISFFIWWDEMDVCIYEYVLDS
jgi:hypothetical protein